MKQWATILTFSSEFVWPVRVYYEDTDAGGVVYHANYLRFMERARTEWLRTLGFEQDHLARTLGIAFVVGHVDLHYHKPAHFNDELLVISRIQKIGGASLVFEQSVWRIRNQPDSRERLLTAHVKVVCVSLDNFHTTPIPISIRNMLQ